MSRAALALALLALMAAPASAQRTPLVTDGCTLAPEFDFGDCCHAHDAIYWKGGTEAERLRADEKFRQCLRDKGHRLLDVLYYLGLRFGGIGALPTPWRWGFGWEWPYSAKPIDGSPRNSAVD